MSVAFPALAISEGRAFTGIWACTDEIGYRQGSRGSFEAGCWDNLELVDRIGRVFRVTDARLEARAPATKWWQRLIPASRPVNVACSLTEAAETDVASLKQRVLRLIDNDEEGFAEMRALYRRDDFKVWRSRVATAESFDELIALFSLPPVS
jgi:hypothetical protein